MRRFGLWFRWTGKAWCLVVGEQGSRRPVVLRWRRPVAAAAHCGALTISYVELPASR